MAVRSVVIAGAGVAAIEMLLAMRSTSRGAGLEITLLAPGEELVYRPLQVLEPFGLPPARRYPLDPIVSEFGARRLADTLARVDGDGRTVVTGAGRRLPYEALVIAVGARRRATLANAHTFFAGAADDGLQRILREVEDGSTRSIAFVVPTGDGWALPLYELVLLTARHAREHGAEEVELSLITPEDTPLAIFQGAGSAAVTRLLERANIETLTSAYVRRYDGRQLDLMPGRRVMSADRVVTLPSLEGPAIDGVPCDAGGFVRSDEYHRVPGMAGVYAIGDATTFPVKQGGIASQHADLVASLIARTAGPDPATRPLLRAVLLTGEEPLYLQATIAGGESIVSSASSRCPWWPPHKIAARHLATYLAERDEAGGPVSRG